jgi:hypothetical protein
MALSVLCLRERGDTADWLQRVEGVSRADALASIGVERRAPRQSDRHRSAAFPASAIPDSSNVDLPRAIWREVVDAAGTLAEAYLHSRRLWLLAGAPLRFHPHCPRGRERLPALVTLMTDPLTGEPCGIHRTFLDPTTGGKASGQAKMMLGRAGVIRLQPDEDIVGGLGLTEGIETGLALIQHAGWRPVWASASAGGMRTLPVLPGIETLTLFPDRDDKGAGIAAAEACAERWRAAGREVRLLLPPEGQDWHDALTGGPSP